ncbi:MAG: ArsR family transcriptional regulator [Verrucomicrobiaceae bacterium]|nr:MAG: ArsR family transcriptional regulator [Verrucomicrobiaceae bacterium]
MLLGGNVGLFGTRTRTDILVLLEMLGESHAAELARLLEIRLSTVQNSLDTLEQAGIAVGVVEGRARRFRLNPRFFAREELKALLEKLGQHDEELKAKVVELRRRPRRAGKAL